jgi:hypothetical protein
MQLRAARAMLAIGQDQDSWDVILDDMDSFIWDENGDEVDTWNAMVGKRAGHEDVAVRQDDGIEAVSFSYMGKTVQVPYIGDREDGQIAIHTLAQLVRSDSEIRYCIESTHSSDKAFLALPPAQWKALEDEFGRDAVAYRFLTIAPDLDTFFVQANADENVRNYGSGEEERTPADESGELVRVQLQTLAQGHFQGAEAYCMTIMDKFVHLLILVDTTAQRDSLYADQRFKDQLHALYAGVPDNISLQSIAIQSQEVISLDPAGFQTSLWWKEGACPRYSWDGVKPDYNARMAEMAAQNGEHATARRDPAGAGAKTQGTEGVPAFLKKHWLPVSFISFMLLMLLFGKT